MSDALDDDAIRVVTYFMLDRIKFIVISYSLYLGSGKKKELLKLALESDESMQLIAVVPDSGNYVLQV